MRIPLMILALLLLHSLLQPIAATASNDQVKIAQTEESPAPNEMLTFTIENIERFGEPILAFDLESPQPVARDDPGADFWLKSDDPRQVGSNFAVEALNGSFIAPEYAGQFPDSVPEAGFVAFGAGLRQDDPIPCKTATGQLCEISAHYEMSADGNHVVLTVTLY
jgi:hypothetical protein